MNKYLICSILIVIVLLYFTCSGDESSSPPLPVDVPDQIMENSTITFTQEGIRSAVIRAEFVAVYEKVDLKKASRIYVDFFDQEGNLTSQLVADSGFIQEKKQKFEARGNVVVTTNEGIKLITESLRWNPETHMIVTNDFITITRGNDVYTGFGLEADEELKHFVIKNKVKAEIKDIPEELKDSL